jgi:hypothetical protein
MERATPLTQGRIFVFWAPLAATWLMMSVEGPLLTALVARLADPRPNLAAYGVAFAVAILVEAPVIMIMSASTALAKGRESFIKLRRYTYALCLGITAVQAALLVTPAWGWIGERLIGLPADVTRLSEGALWLLLPWPGAIGYRRFYQGLLIRSGRTRRVAYGTVIRVATMATTAAVLFVGLDLPGAYLGGAALSVGVICEALASRLMSRHEVRDLLDSDPGTGGQGGRLTYARIHHFYYPLAITSVVSLAIHPLVTFFVGQSRMSLESLAVIPVIGGLLFPFRAVGISYQEAVIALIGDRLEQAAALRRFAVMLALAVGVALGLVAFTPLAGMWFRGVSGLDLELSRFAVVPTMILVAIPPSAVWLSWQRGVLVKVGRTGPLSVATGLEVGGVVAVLALAIHGLDLVGAVAASVALVVGRALDVAFLARPAWKTLRAPR